MTPACPACTQGQPSHPRTRARTAAVNETTNQRVQWFSMLTIAIVITQAVLQTWHLYSYFKKKKYI